MSTADHPRAPIIREGLKALSFAACLSNTAHLELAEALFGVIFSTTDKNVSSSKILLLLSYLVRSKHFETPTNHAHNKTRCRA